MPVFPASSYMVGNAPGGVNYAAPIMDFSAIRDWPSDYFKGTQEAHTLALQNAFKDGMPTTTDPKSGQQVPDVTKIQQTLLQLGGADYAKQILPFIMGGEIMRNTPASDSDVLSGGQPAPPQQSPNGTVTRQPDPNARSTTVPGASGPANITGNRGQPAQPQLSSAGADDNGQYTLNTLAAETGADIPQGAIGRVALALGLNDASAPLSGDQVTNARSMLNGIAGKLAKSSTTGGGASVIPVGGTSGNGAPVQGTTAETASPASGIVPQTDPNAPMVPKPVQTVRVAQQATPIPGAIGGQNYVVPGVPQGAEQARIQAIDARIAAIQTAAAGASYSGNEALAKQYDARIAQLKAERDRITGAMTTQANATQAAQTEANKGLAEGMQKPAVQKFINLQQEAGDFERDLKPKLDAADAVLNRPGIWTGAGADQFQAVMRGENIFGSNTAALREILEKVTAQSVINQTTAMKQDLSETGSASARLFKEQIDLMGKAAPSGTNTLQGNRALVEMERRQGKQQQDIAELARNYLGPLDQYGVGTKHRTLDAGFEPILSDYLQKNPMFKPNEISNPAALLGAPKMPPGLSDPQRLDWAQQWGIKEGEIVKTSDGRYKAWHYGTPQQPGAAQAAPVR